MKGQLIGKDLDAEKDGGQEEKGATENEMVGWHHLLMNVNLSKLCKIVKYREAWHVAGSTWGQRVRHDLGTEQQHEE